MAKPAVTSESFLKNLSKFAPRPEETALEDHSAPSSPPKKAGGTRAGLKHIGAYLNRETVEKIAILRARLNLDNSQLIKRAIDQMYSVESAARKFGDA